MPREVTTDMSVLERLVAPAGKDVLDIGCGGGALVRELAGRGARPLGLEISAEQLASALARDEDALAGEESALARRDPPAPAEIAASPNPTPARYLIGTAQALPLEDGCVDVAIFMRALHHVPSADLIAALREARRVLRPDGMVYVAEPLPEGGYYAITSLVEDELEARAAAQRALAEAERAGLERAITVEYEVRLRIADLAALRARFVSVDPRRAGLFDARADRIAAAFERLGEPGELPGERCFLQPMRADVLRPATTYSDSRHQPPQHGNGPDQPRR
ncbi:MAG TPA: class I SAM-dependent methyltransferase [Solirubrobacteraceae bacterium]|nr:class I SAM-dependent methyltransferase [Solirubrobacteraceae bacterium]